MSLVKSGRELPAFSVAVDVNKCLEEIKIPDLSTHGILINNLIKESRLEHIFEALP